VNVLNFEQRVLGANIHHQTTVELLSSREYERNQQKYRDKEIFPKTSPTRIRKKRQSQHSQQKLKDVVPLGLMSLHPGHLP